ncbi:uncharacterized protein [Watersipora subatra]|uniref:uncharacterized protein isoform X1 n=2 Tax=Watersipora subatra TaxID=2589382 RepID=UPI00355B861C
MFSNLFAYSTYHQSTTESSFKEEKIIVSVTALQRLFHCHTCALPCSFTMVREGGWVEFKVTCASCHRSYTWETTARVNRAHVINPLLAAASLFPGGCLTQNLRFLSLLNIAIPSHSVCLYQQREYLHGCIAEQYTLHNEGLMAAIDWELDLAGDGRCDSPGHCALYRAYTMMDQSCGLIVSSHLVKSTETTSSNTMELEGFKRCQSDLISHGLRVRSITTDVVTKVVCILQACVLAYAANLSP